MTRRAFVQKLVQTLKWTMTASLLPFNSSCSASKLKSTSTEDLMTQFQKLTLEEIARRKLHHGRNRFLNPLSSTSPAGFFNVVKWKLFSKNSFKHLYSQETMQPVTIEWGPVTHHRGVSVTFINHACVMIKDIDHYLLIDPVFFGINRWIDNY